MKQSFISLLIILSATILLNNVHAQSGYKITKTFHISSSGGWDYTASDPGSNNLYLSHGTQVNILDRTTGDSVGFIPNTTGVHGIAFVNALGKGYTSNGKINTVTVFDLKTFKILGQIETGKNPDWIMYDNFSKKVVTSNHTGGDISIIDPTTDKVVNTINIGGKLETSVSDNAGKLFINVEDKSEIAVVDLAKNEVVARWPFAPSEGGTGLSIDTKTKRLFVACEKALVVLDATNGKIVATLPTGADCDGDVFDAGTNLIFAACGDGTLTVIKEISGDEFKVIENVVTKHGAKTIAIDPKSHNIFLPTAEYEPMAEGVKGRPKMIGGTFQVLVLEKK